MASTRPGVVVTGLTLAALAAVGLLAFQANGAESRAAAARPAVTASPSPTASPTPTASPVPANSGTGHRVVYSIGQHQVWLVEPKKTPPLQASFKVTPGTVEPAVGSYQVYSRAASGTGTDGKQIEHVVRFVQQNGTTFGFSATTDGSTDTPKIKTGGIRSTRTDGQSLWDFAPNGTKVVVVP